MAETTRTKTPLVGVFVLEGWEPITTVHDEYVRGQVCKVKISHRRQPFTEDFLLRLSIPVVGLSLRIYLPVLLVHSSNLGLSLAGKNATDHDLEVVHLTNR